MDENETPETMTTFKDAVLDMGQLLKDLKSLGVPHAVGLDVIRLQMMYLAQQPEPTGVRVPQTAPNEVLMAEAFEAQDDE